MLNDVQDRLVGGSLGEESKTLNAIMVLRRGLHIRLFLIVCLDMDNMSTRHFKLGNIKAELSDGFCEHGEADFLTWLEQLHEHGRVLKTDKKAVLVRSQYDKRDLVVKHYQHIGLLHTVGHALTRSRAQNSWQASLSMSASGIPTPKALACVERFKSGMVYESYFVYEFREGRNFREYAWSTPVSQIFTDGHLHRVYAILRGLKRHKISHGDMKMPNIILTEQGPVLIDLDQTRILRSNRQFAKRRLRDLRRFRRELPWNRGQGPGVRRQGSDA